MFQLQYGSCEETLIIIFSLVFSDTAVMWRQVICSITNIPGISAPSVTYLKGLVERLRHTWLPVKSGLGIWCLKCSFWRQETVTDSQCDGKASRGAPRTGGGSGLQRKDSILQSNL